MTTANSTPAANCEWPFSICSRGVPSFEVALKMRTALETVITICARVPEGEPLEPGQVSFLLEKATEALG